MKRHLITALVAIGLLATFDSCSEEEDDVDTKTLNTSSTHHDYDYIEYGEGEVYYFKDGIRTFAQVKERYLRTTPLSLEKYKNGSSLDSVCNKDITLVFEGKADKKHDKSALWALPPRVVTEHPPIVTVTSDDETYIIKLSKMVTAFGLELNTPYKGFKYGVTVSYWDSKLNKILPNSGTRFLHSTTQWDIQFGDRGGAYLWGVESKTPFNEIRIDIIKTASLPAIGPFRISFAGFRYRLAK